MNGLEKLIDDLHLLTGPGSLIKFDSDGSRIAHLIEEAIVSLFVDEEIRSGLVFTPLVKDLEAFESEKRFKTPFYENLTREGIVL
jgi:hypothetical protein